MAVVNLLAVVAAATVDSHRSDAWAPVVGVGTGASAWEVAVALALASTSGPKMSAGMPVSPTHACPDSHAFVLAAGDILLLVMPDLRMTRYTCPSNATRAPNAYLASRTQGAYWSQSMVTGAVVGASVGATVVGLVVVAEAAPRLVLVLALVSGAQL